MRSPEQSGSIHYVIASASEILSAAAGLGGGQGMLSQAELAKAARFRDTRDTDGYVAAHVLFRVMAARSLGLTPDQGRNLEPRLHCQHCAGPHGKPSIEGTNLSLSRVRDVVMVASASAGAPIGADHEAIPRELPEDFDDFALSPAEGRQLASGDVEARLRVWVAKEAALKATGHGLLITPSKLHLGQRGPHPSAEPLPEWSATIESPGLREAHGLQIAWVPAPSGHTAALAAFGRPSISRLDVRSAFEGP